MRGFLFGRWKLGEGVVLLRFLWGWFRAFFLKRFIERSVCGVVSEGVGCVRDSAMVSTGSRLDDADGNPLLLVRQRHGGLQLAWRVFWWLIDTDTSANVDLLRGNCILVMKNGQKIRLKRTGNRYKIVILMSRMRKLKGLVAASLGLKTFDDNP